MAKNKGRLDSLTRLKYITTSSRDRTQWPLTLKISLFEPLWLLTSDITHNLTESLYPWQQNKIWSINPTKKKFNWNHTYSEQLLLCFVHTLQNWLNSNSDTIKCNIPFIPSDAKLVNEMSLAFKTSLQNFLVNFF